MLAIKLASSNYLPIFVQLKFFNFFHDEKCSSKKIFL